MQKLPEETIKTLRSGIGMGCVSQAIEELVMNSIDASATNIVIRVDTGGLGLEVVDNGTGITETNLNMVGERYHTSKADGRSLGYKGEALASIAEISENIIITTKTDGQYEAIQRNFAENRFSRCPRNLQGTTVEVVDFFSKLPVRKAKLLRSKPAKIQQDLTSIVRNLCLAHPQVSFRLFYGENLLIAKPPTEPGMATYSAVLGETRQNDTLVLRENHWQNDEGCIWGMVSKGCTTHTKDYQILIVNGRPVKCHIVDDIINTIYSRSRVGFSKDYAQNGARHPAYAVYITLPRTSYEVTPNGTFFEMYLKRPQLLSPYLMEAVCVALQTAGYQTPNCLGLIHGAWVAMPLCQHEEPVEEEHGEEEIKEEPHPTNEKLVPLMELLSQKKDELNSPEKVPAPRTPSNAALKAFLFLKNGGSNEEAKPTQAVVNDSKPLVPMEAAKPISPSDEALKALLLPQSSHPRPVPETNRVNVPQPFVPKGQPPSTVPAARPVPVLPEPAPEPVVPSPALFKKEAKITSTVPVIFRRWYDQHNTVAPMDRSQVVLGTTLTRDDVKKFRLVGQSHLQFIIGEVKGTVCAVDQHAADERCKLEALKESLASMVSGRKSSNTIHCTPEEYWTVRETEDELKKWGWAVAYKEGCVTEVTVARVALVQFPSWVAEPREVVLKHELVIQAAIEISKGGPSTTPSSYSRLLASKACRSALMFNTYVAPSDCRALIAALSKTKDPFHCAHGRPSIAPLCALPEDVEPAFKKPKLQSLKKPPKKPKFGSLLAMSGGG
eukprot:TRINITY_DN24576_c0_g1_i1.p1 TRINITY_DN24576_c0_g1~~TRINITY_DN24576_c0_g1_i1.p1  ORF type:complete len:795 (+),score=147.15 TRINITY_DN24576_c0_g1_i1:46-2385(+)